MFEYSLYERGMMQEKELPCMMQRYYALIRWIIYQNKQLQ